LWFAWTFPGKHRELEDAEFRIAICAKEEVAVVIHTNRGRVKEYSVEKGKVCLLKPQESGGGGVPEASGSGSEARFAGFEGNGEVNGGSGAVARRLAIDVLPAEGFFDVHWAKSTRRGRRPLTRQARGGEVPGGIRY